MVDSSEVYIVGVMDEWLFCRYNLLFISSLKHVGCIVLMTHRGVGLFNGSYIVIVIVIEGSTALWDWKLFFLTNRGVPPRAPRIRSEVVRSKRSRHPRGTPGISHLSLPDTLLQTC